jgi:hypothetical protein
MFHKLLDSPTSFANCPKVCLFNRRQSSLFVFLNIGKTGKRTTSSLQFQRHICCCDTFIGSKYLGRWQSYKHSELSCCENEHVQLCGINVGPPTENFVHKLPG